MRKDKNEEMEEHFAKLKELLPELYNPINKLPRNISEQLYSLLKSSLGIIEALYMQAPEHVSSAKADAYASIVTDLKKLGITYQGNEELLRMAASKVIMQSKMPMERAGVRKREEDKKKAG